MGYIASLTLGRTARIIGPDGAAVAPSNPAEDVMARWLVGEPQRLVLLDEFDDKKVVP